MGPLHPRRKGSQMCDAQMAEGNQDRQSCRSCGRGGDSGPRRAGGDKDIRALVPPAARAGWAYKDGAAHGWNVLARTSSWTVDLETNYQCKDKDRKYLAGNGGA